MENTSGIHPVEYKVLVKPKTLSKKTAGGIIMPDEVVDREQYTNSFGQIVEFGGNAFEGWVIAPEKGAFIMFDKYAGSSITGQDGVDYKLINDKEIVAQMDKEQ